VRSAVAAPVVIRETIADRPALSPECPRDAVIPPLNRMRPALSYKIVCPDACAPNRLASIPPGSLKTLAPGIAPALRHSPVFSQSSGEFAGRTNITAAAALPCKRVISIESSPIVAFVHGHFGCAKTTTIGIPGTRCTLLSVGHCAGGSPASAGPFS